MRRRLRMLAVLVLAAGLAPTVWLRTTRPPPTPVIALRFTPEAMPGDAATRKRLGPFRLEGVWRMDSRHRLFGGYSALLALDDGDFLAISDRGYLLRFFPPGVSGKPEAIEPIFSRNVRDKTQRDFEAATRDPETGTFWTTIENYNIIARQHFVRGRLRLSGLAEPEAMSGWRGNSGPEAMVRMADGRFVILRESPMDDGDGRSHEALLFARDPIEDRTAQRFTVRVPEGYSPTDMAQLPEGRLLVLLRRLHFAFPQKFDCRLALGDPDAIGEGEIWTLRSLARLEEPLPVDNCEGLAVVPGGKGRTDVWIISDDNRSAFQRTLLMKLSVDLADLPGTHLEQARKKARGDAARPSANAE